MRVFRTTYRDAGGNKRKAAKWYVEFRDHAEMIRRLSAFASKPASEELGRNLAKLVAYHKASGGQVDPSLSNWLTGLPLAIQKKLVEVGLLSPERASVAKTLVDQVDDFAKSLEAKGNSTIHIDVITARARRIVAGCGFQFYRDVQASKVAEFLNDLRKDTDKMVIGAQFGPTPSDKSARKMDPP